MSTSRSCAATTRPSPTPPAADQRAFPAPRRRVGTPTYRAGIGTHLEIGRWGEDAAARVYADRGYRVVARNWRCRIGELDLILRRGDTLVVCEVKARRGSRLGGGHEAVDGRKQRKLRAVAEVFLQRSGEMAGQVRFDVASVVVGPSGSARVDLFEDAF